MTFQRLEAIARIRDQAKEKVVGAGFLVSDKHILTCAHVVNAALGKPLNAIDEPSQQICLDFPLVASGKILKGRVVRWIPVQPSSSILPETGADMALLELESPLPEGIQPIRLITAENLWKHPFRVFGFPKGQSSGVYTDGIIRETLGNGRVQIDVLPSSAYRIEPGFSGSPVWDEQLDGVAGMTVAIDSGRPENRAAFIIPTTQLINACPELAEQAIPPCPYRGLFAFREQDAQYFFGREKFTEKLVDAVQRQSLVAVIGASGSGKSSVVFAGLIPQLRSQEGWLIESFRPGDNPLKNLAAKLVPLLERDMSAVDQLVEVNKLVNRLQEGELGLKDVVKLILENNSDGRLLLIADQFEELYTLCKDNSERQLFLDQLLETVKQTENFKLVLTLRADFFGYALSYRPFADALQDADRKLGPMNHEELQEAIEKPAKLLGVRLESGLTKRILEAVEKEPGNLPLLEFALEKMWAKQQNGQLTHQAYEDIGGVEKALAKYAQEQYEDLSEEDKEKAQQVFIQLVRPGEGTEDTRRLATRDEVGKDNWDLVTRKEGLADARLVITNKIQKTLEQEVTEQETVEIIHEALISEWGTLRGWMNDHREFRTWQEQLKVRIQEWEKTGRNNEALLQNIALAKAEDWLNKRKNELSKAEKYFLGKSIEKKEFDKRKIRRVTQLRLITVSCILATLGGMTTFSYQQKQIANRESLRTEIESKIVIAEEFIDSSGDNIRQGVSLTVDLVEISQKNFNRILPNVEQLLYKANSIPLASKVYKFTEGDAILSPQWSWVAKRRNGVVEIRDVQGRLQTILEDTRDNPVKLLFSPDEKFIATIGDEPIKKNVATIWNLEGKLVTKIQGQEGQCFEGLKFSPDVKFVVVVLYDGEMCDSEFKIYNLPHSPTPKISGDDDISYGDHMGKTEVWDLQGNKLFELGSRLRGDAKNIFFSPNGKYIATIAHDNIARIWNNQGKLIKELQHSTIALSGTFSDDNKWFATSHPSYSANENAVMIWDLKGNLQTILKGHNGWVRSIDFSPDGKYIVSGAEDGIVRIWDLNGILIRDLNGHTDNINQITFSPNGQYIATASADNTSRIWNIEGDLITELREHKDDVFEVFFSPNSEQLATISHIDDTLRMWNLKKSTPIILKSSPLSINEIIFDSKGQQIFLRDSTGPSSLWNLQGKMVNHLNKISNMGKKQLRAINFSPNTRNIAMYNFKSKKVEIVDYEGKMISETKGSKISPHSVEFSPNGQFFATVNGDNVMQLWNLDGELITDLRRTNGDIGELIFSPDNNYILAGSRGGFIDIWNLQGEKIISDRIAFQEIGLLDIQPFGKDLIKFSPTSSFVLVCTPFIRDIGSILLILDIQGNILATLKGHMGFIKSMDISPNERYIAVASMDNTTRIWDLQDNTFVELKGHANYVDDIAFSPDGKRVLTGSTDGSARLWDLQGNLLIVLKEDDYPINTVAFSPDGKWLATGSKDGTARILPAQPQLLLKRLCNQLENNQYCSTTK